VGSGKILTRASGVVLGDINAAGIRRRVILMFQEKTKTGKTSREKRAGKKKHKTF